MNARFHSPNRTATRRRAPNARRALWLAAAVVAVLVLPWMGPGAAAQTPALSEYQVKALFLVNFAKYVDWPPTAFSGGNAPIVIGVAGEDKFGDNFKQVIGGKTINDRPVVVKHVGSDQEYRSCHILFISASEKDRLAEILGAVAGSAVLTVGETDQFHAQDGMINLRKKDNKVRLEINLATAQRAGLKLSSKLLGVADEVTGRRGEGKGP